MSDFTVVVSVKQAFGNEPGYLNRIGPHVAFTIGSDTSNSPVPMNAVRQEAT